MYKIKHLFLMGIIFTISYLIIPITLLKFYNTEDINKLALSIILITAFLSFSTNLIYSYLQGKFIVIPLLSIIISLFLLIIFNKTAILVIIIVSFLSILGYFLGNLFTKENKEA